MNVVVLGELCEDILMHNPNSVEVFEQKIWAKDVTVTAGGSAVYVSEALSRMGVDVRLCSVVGDDESGKRMLRDLQAFPVDCSMVRMLPNSDTTRSIVICDGPEKDFKGCSPMLPLYIPDIEDLGGAELLYVAGYVLYPELWTAEARDLLKKAKERGITVALDVQMFPVEGIDQLEFSHLEGVLPYVDIFFAARKEMLGLLKTEDPAGCMKLLQEMGFRGTAVFKQGGKGCVVATGGELVRRPGCTVEAYDTVGSGDIFGASYCYGAMSGWDSRRCADYAAVFTALSIGEYHNVKNYPAKEAVEAVLSTID